MRSEKSFLIELLKTMMKTPMFPELLRRMIEELERGQMYPEEIQDPEDPTQPLALPLPPDDENEEQQAPTLHDLYDIIEEEENPALDPRLDSVVVRDEDVLPECSAEEAMLACGEMFPEHLFTPSPSPPPASAECSSDLTTVSTCDEDSDNDMVLDFPRVPGVDCKSCMVHRKRAATGDIKCSLCYMRLCSDFVFGKYILLVTRLQMVCKV